MSYTTPDAVQRILGGNYDGESDLLPYVETADAIMAEVIACATAKGLSISAALQERIAAYLSAHFYGHHDQFYNSRSTQGASGAFQGRTDIGFESTYYGQTALRLDTTGCLNAFDKRSRASMHWLGTRARNVTRSGGL